MSLRYSRSKGYSNRVSKTHGHGGLAPGRHSRKWCDFKKQEWYGNYKRLVIRKSGR